MGYSSDMCISEWESELTEVEGVRIYAFALCCAG